MLSLIEQIKSGALWDFPGGVHPPENKKQSVKSEIARASIPQEIVLPVKQHIGKPGTITVEVGEQVLKGQPLTKYDTSFMLPVHAPTSGKITAIESRTTAHPSGLAETCIIISPDGEDRWIERKTDNDFTQRTPDELIEIIRQAGVSGMGGAGFPTAKKIQAGLARTEILIVNAAECEPYITADDMLMQEHADEVIKGIEIVEHILNPKLTIIGIEDNKPQAIKALEQAAEHKDIVIRVIPTKYPSGGEKQLIKILTNKEVPANSIPADIGLLVQNVGSLQAIKRAVCDGEPLVDRIVTLTGDTFKQPRNVKALIGTPVQSLLDEFGYKADKKLPRLIMGGPMMGFTLPHANVPITKTANCILAPTRKEVSPNQYEMACIRCGQCAEACPASLLPQQLQWHAKAEEYDKCEELNLKDCIECGACAFVCPSEIPLVQYYRQAKAEMRTRKEESEAAERAKIRFEEKKARLERDKAERENRFKKAADDRRKDMKKTGGDDAIAAAIARVKAQKSEAKSDEPAVKPAVAAAIAKAKAKQAAAMQAGDAEPDNSEMAKLREERKRQAREKKAQKTQDATPTTSSDDKKDAVAAAIARAKAKKAAQQNNGTDSATEDKKASVAAAIARAKARKAQQEGKSEPVTTEPENAVAGEDPKKAAVAAAIARAKARKAQQEGKQGPVTVEPENAKVAEEDPKKAAVAAAIARAKARKAQQEGKSEPITAEPESAEVTEEDPKKVAAAIARAKARKAQQEAEPESTEPAEEDPKKAAVAAAIARAKARKAQQEAKSAPVTTKSESTEVAEEHPKKAAVAAAIARAKARKAQQEGKSEPVTTESESAEVAEEDPKKAAVAAAIARAKARKAQQEGKSEPVTAEPESTEVAGEDPKKAAVAAAIARAKARKAEREQNNKFEEKE
ncbi:electron transport complex subunit RsxC [Vibrio coralliilyticus OCN008]|uniref:electron transport complex subunit RsxC n=1 Tax=Vibrio coralliilyticus TaxID=190893 RepID=UPI0013F3BFED|nr:electron transport complex subunit RsxC [Vibrio coralliilyticus]QIJ84288.1 electron transport complex subunit RsxC [Vibrio coralliilyticus OCN008]